MLSRILLVVVALWPALAWAQGVPLVSVDLTRGDGRHTLQTPTVYYYDGSASFMRTAMTVRLGTAGAIRPIVVLEANSDCAFIDTCGDLAICTIAPNGTCRQNFHEPIGAAAAVGVAGTLGSHLLGAATVGGAQGARHLRYIDASVTIRLFRYLGAIVGARQMVWTDGNGDRTWFAPISVGLRAY